ncbi:MAG: hypothetical protein PHH62_07265, partial [Endomicrobiaceae bacterium]|nr:hypothetical protein [Endomicrobiaceae bacterium]
MNYINIIKKISLIFAGILIALIILEISLQIAEFTSIAIKNYNNKNNKDSNTITILCLGESTTHGQWPPILQNTLNKKIKNKKIKVIDEGKTNIKTDFILSEINNTLFKYNPDIVICMIGVNDLGIKFNNSRIKTVNILKILWMY